MQRPGKALAEDISRATARPASTKTPPPFAWSYQPNQLGRPHLRGNMQLPGQISKHMRGDMQIFVKTLPPCQPNSQLTWRYNASSAWTRVGARRGDDSWDEFLCHPQ